MQFEVTHSTGTTGETKETFNASAFDIHPSGALLLKDSSGLLWVVLSPGSWSRIDLTHEGDRDPSRSIYEDEDMKNF